MGTARSDSAMMSCWLSLTGLPQSNQHENNEFDSATQLIFEEFECLLESISAEPFDNDYRLLVRAAKSRIIRETQRGF